LESCLEKTNRRERGLWYEASPGRDSSNRKEEPHQP